MADNTKNQITIQSTRRAAMELVSQIAAEATAARYSKKAIYGIQTALDEALANAIKHGNQDDPDKSIFVEYSVTDEEVRVQIKDEGTGSERLSDDLSQESAPGSGVMLMFAYMTEVIFSDGGRCVTLVKHRDCSKPKSRQDQSS